MVVRLSSKPVSWETLTDIRAELLQIGQRVAPKFSVDERYFNLDLLRLGRIDRSPF